MSCVEADLSDRDILEAARRVLADPDRVVRDPENLYETAHGTSVPFTGYAARGCFLGAIRLGMLDLGVPAEEVEAAQPRLYEMERTRMYPVLVERHGETVLREADTDPFTYTLREEGPEGCIAVIDKVLEADTEGSSG